MNILNAHEFSAHPGAVPSLLKSPIAPFYSGFSPLLPWACSQMERKGSIKKKPHGQIASSQTHAAQRPAQFPPQTLMFGQYKPKAIVKWMKHPIYVTTPHSHTPAGCGPGGTSANSQVPLDPPKQQNRFLKDSSPKMSALFQISQHGCCTAITYTWKIFLLSKKFQEIHGLVSTIM